eukprot:1136127-Pelagomonas_calceolata.AAC.2
MTTPCMHLPAASCEGANSRLLGANVSLLPQSIEREFSLPTEFFFAACTPSPPSSPPPTHTLCMYLRWFHYVRFCSHARPASPSPPPPPALCPPPPRHARALVPSFEAPPLPAPPLQAAGLARPLAHLTLS